MSDKPPKRISDIISSALGGNPKIPEPLRVMPEIHLHDLMLMNAQAGMRVPMQPATTILLYGCKECEHVETGVIDGTWNIDQLLALHAPESAPESTKEA